MFYRNPVLTGVLSIFASNIFTAQALFLKLINCKSLMYKDDDVAADVIRIARVPELTRCHLKLASVGVLRAALHDVVAWWRREQRVALILIVSCFAMCFSITLLALGWVLHVNAQDRKLLEKELEADRVYD